MILDQFGQPILRYGSRLEGLLDENQNQFQGVVNMLLYDDAIACKALCAFCQGDMEGVLRFPKSYLRRCPDKEERIRDAKSQVIAKIKREHQCGPRLNKDKMDVDAFLARFL